jgi:hypothetical protein
MLKNMFDPATEVVFFFFSWFSIGKYWFSWKCCRQNQILIWTLKRM